MAEKESDQPNRKPRHAWYETGDSNPENVYFNNIQPQPTATATAQVHGQVVTNQPVSDISKIFADAYCIWNIVNLSGKEGLSLNMDSLRQDWKHLLENDERVKLLDSLKEFMEANFILYQHIVGMCVRIKERLGQLTHLIFPEEIPLGNSWQENLNVVNNDVQGLKRNIEVFMIMQLQLEEVKDNLEKQYRMKADKVAKADGERSSRIPMVEDSEMDTSHYAPGFSTTTGHGPTDKHIDNLQEDNSRLRQHLQEMGSRYQKLQEEDRKHAKEIKKLQSENARNCEYLRQINASQNGELQQKLGITKKKLMDKEEELEKEISTTKKLFDKNVQVTRSLADEREKTEHMKYAIGLLKNEIDKHKSDILEKEKIAKALDMEKKTILKNVEQYQVDVENQLCTRETEIHRLRMKISELEKDKNTLKKSKEDLLTRLSKVAGAKLTHGNADITDLSDENRPVKIAEKLSELYDNEWTDALEELSMMLPSEEEAIKMNLRIISTAFTFCSEVSRLHSDNLMQSLTHLPLLQIEESVSEAINVNRQGAPISNEIGKDIEDIRKSLAPQLITVAVKRFILNVEKMLRVHLKPGHRMGATSTYDIDRQNIENKDETNDHQIKSVREDWDLSTDSSSTCKAMCHQLSVNEQDEATDLDKETERGSLCCSGDVVGSAELSVFSKLPNTKIFAEKCANICWLMTLQDPKLHMVCDWQRGVDFNMDIFRHYTRTGKKLDYVVWPVLYLYKKGPLLGKGVAQPLP